MSAPFEVLGGPLEIFTAPVGEAFPDLDTTPPGGNWLALGVSGARNYEEDGVTMNLDQEVEAVRALGGTGPIKFRRSSEDLKISAVIMDMTAEIMSVALNSNTVATVAPGSGSVGTREVDFYRGPDTVTQFALLARGDSPYIEGGIGQIQIPIVVVTSSPEPVYKKGSDVAGVLIMFEAQEDPAASTEADRFGSYIVAHLAALP